MSLPFQQGSGRVWFPPIPLPFPPYLHQEKASLRLRSASRLNTPVAKGSGSGRTEYFLPPLLDDCRQKHAQGSRGIKAILIDPIKALATDQARRIAQLIHFHFTPGWPAGGPGSTSVPPTMGPRRRWAPPA